MRKGRFMVRQCKHRWMAAAWSAAVVFGAAGVSAQVDAPVHSRDLSRKFAEAHGAGNYARAIEIGEQWVALKPKDDGAAYNLACAYAMHGDKAKAIEWLKKSVERGWDQPGFMMQDTDLASLHGDPAFVDVVGVARERQKPRLEHARTSKPLVVVPPSLDKSRATPLIVAMHGYGGNAESFARIWRGVAADAGAILALPRAVRSVSMSGFGWGDVDEAHAIIESTLDQVTRQHNIDPRRIVLTGFSQGGRMAFALGARMAPRFCGVIPVAGRFVAGDSIPPSLHASGGAKYYLMVGAEDRAPTIESNRLAKKELSAAGHDVELVVYPGLGHAFPDDKDAELKKALRFVLGTAAP